MDVGTRKAHDQLAKGRQALTVTRRFITIDGTALEKERFVRALREKDASATRRLVHQLKDDRRTGASQGLAIVSEAFGRELAGYIARLTRDRDTIPDILVDTLERVFLRIDSYDPRRSAFRTWLYEQVRYSAIEWWKRQQRTSRDTAEPVSVLEAEDIESLVDAGGVATTSEKRALRRAFRRLRPVQRELLWWVEVQGMKPTEVARSGLAGNVRENQVKVYVWRARQALRALYEAELGGA